MHQRLACIISFLLFFAHAEAQQVFASGGNADQNSYTLGEVFTSTLSASDLQLTQGFHQTFLEVTSVEEQGSVIELTVFPNPTRFSLTVQSLQQIPEALAFFDMQGRLVLHLETSLSERTEIDLTPLARGAYMLVVHLNGEAHTFRILKH